MGCSICGRSSCTASFHSHEEQQAYDEAVDKIKDQIVENVKKEINNKLSKLSAEWVIDPEGVEYCAVNIDEVSDIIDNIQL